MAQLLWDASALSKRYSLEAGSPTVDAVFASGSAVSRMIATYLGYAETCAALRRKFNRGEFSFALFTTARVALRQEVLVHPDFALLTVGDAHFLDGVEFTDQYNLNSADAATLAAYLDYARAQPTTAAPCVLVASDQRLLRAAQAEGLVTLDPESLPAADVPAFLASL